MGNCVVTVVLAVNNGDNMVTLHVVTCLEGDWWSSAKHNVNHILSQYIFSTNEYITSDLCKYYHVFQNYDIPFCLAFCAQYIIFIKYSRKQLLLLLCMCGFNFQHKFEHNSAMIKDRTKQRQNIKCIAQSITWFMTSQQRTVLLYTQIMPISACTCADSTDQLC